MDFRIQQQLNKPAPRARWPGGQSAAAPNTKGKKMKTIRGNAADVFRAAIEMLAAAGGEHVKIDSGRGYMPLVVEQIGAARLDPDGERLPLYSFCHYGEQNGDLMRDPDIVMIDGGDQGLIPVSYRNDYAGFYQEYCDYSGSSVVCTDEESQDELVVFCHGWAANIHDQQGIGALKPAEV